MRRKIRIGDFCRIAETEIEKTILQSPKNGSTDPREPIFGINWFVKVNRVNHELKTAHVTFYINGNQLSRSTATVPLASLRLVQYLPGDHVISKSKLSGTVRAIRSGTEYIMNDGNIFQESELSYFTRSMFARQEQQNIRYAGTRMWIEGDTEYAAKTIGETKINLRSGDSILPIGGLAGVAQRIINMIPEHDVYISLFAGKDAIFRSIRKAQKNYLVDQNPRIIAWWELFLKKHQYTEPEGIKINLSQSDALNYWIDPDKAGMLFERHERRFYLIDPPYPMETRAGNIQYEFELGVNQHEHLISRCIQLAGQNIFLMLFTFPNGMYSSLLNSAGWHLTTMPYTTRTGVKELQAWTSYDPNKISLHDTNHVGENWDDRRRIKRKAARLIRKLQEVKTHFERQAILSHVLTEFNYSLKSRHNGKV